jgi:hypothetical protein
MFKTFVSLLSGHASYMRSVFDRNVVMGFICVHENYRFVRCSVAQKEYVKTSQCVLAQDRHKRNGIYDSSVSLLHVLFHL